MSCSVYTGKYLATTSTTLATYGSNLATANYCFSNGKISIGDLIHEKGSNATLKKFTINQTLSTTAGVLVTTALRVHVYGDSAAVTSTVGQAFDLTGSALPIASFVIGDSGDNDWITIDTLHAQASKDLDLPIWGPSGSKAVYISIQNNEALTTISSNSFEILAVTEMN